MSRLKIYIVGAGGVGGYFGGLMAKAGENVTFVCRNESFMALKNNGLNIKSIIEEFKIYPVNVIDNLSDISDPDLIIIATKSYDRDQVAEKLKARLRPNTIIITIQNGIENDLKVKEIIPNACVYPGIAYIISKIASPGVIEQTAGPRTIIFGDRQNANNPQLKKIEKVMKSCSINATASSEIEMELWTKFLWITTFAGMTALCRSPIGEIVNDPDLYKHYIRCLDEAIAVARAIPVKLKEGIRKTIIEKSEQYKHTGSDSKSSLLVDLENGRRTEIEDLNGTIVKLARLHGVEVPIQETIYFAIKLASS